MDDWMVSVPFNNNLQLAGRMHQLLNEWQTVSIIGTKIKVCLIPGEFLFQIRVEPHRLNDHQVTEVLLYKKK